jgi:DNA-binding NarL/FixJ family response regulator
MPELTILIVGHTERAEFREAHASLARLGRIVAAANIDEAVARLADGSLAPDLIVIVQAFPGEFSAEALDRLRQLAPLARVLGLLGAWCEGETRTGKPWPGAIRVYWHEWQPRAAQELPRLREGLGSSWALPLTASEEERFLALAEQPFEPRTGLIAIATLQFDMHDWLAAACRRRGSTTAWLRPPYVAPEGVTAAIFDATDCQGEELQQLRQLTAALGPTPVVVLMDFPRVEDRDRVLSAGAAAVVSKPLLIEDLFWQLDHVVGDRETVD